MIQSGVHVIALTRWMTERHVYPKEECRTIIAMRQRASRCRNGVILPQRQQRRRQQRRRQRQQHHHQHVSVHHVAGPQNAPLRTSRTASTAVAAGGKNAGPSVVFGES